MDPGVWQVELVKNLVPVKWDNTWKIDGGP